MKNWRQSLSNAIMDFSTLCEMLSISPNAVSDMITAEKSFPLRVPREFVARMEKGNPRDPLLLQVLPQAIEMLPTKNYCHDPLQELQKNPVPGLLHKYFGRVLLTLTGGCAIHCRYCFRRHFPYADNLPGRENWQRALQYIADNHTIEEVILSGGDPMLLQDHLLAAFSLQLEKIAHVQRLRIHTRLPIVIPSRVTEDWITWMQKSRFQIVVVVHCNHPNEIDHEVIHALKRLKKAEITLFNQSVLLKGVNDHANTLIELSKKLFQAGVLPYYLHLLDHVQGAAHFDVDEIVAEKLMSEIETKLPGFLVPRLAREVPGWLSKKF